MKKTLLTLCIVLLVLATSLQLKSQIRIQPLGNSITEGKPGPPIVYSYRYELWRMLDSIGVNIDMVGSRSVNFEGTVDYPDSQFDVDHEGHWGWNTGEIVEKLTSWLTGYTVDVSLIHLGTNDSKIDSITIAANFNTMIDQLRTNNPNVTIFLAETITPWVTKVNTMVPLIAADRTTDQSPIIVVDHYTGFINDEDNPNTMTWDWVHPNELGDKYMANNWLKAILANFHLVDKSPPTQAVLTEDKTFSSAVAFSWVSDDDSPMTYDVYIDGDSIATVLDTFYIASGLLPNTAYNFQIIATDLGKNSSVISNVLNVTTASPVNYTLLVSGTNGSVSRDPNSVNDTYLEGTVVALTPISNLDYIFTGWTADVPVGHENDNPLNVFINGDKTITATFTRVQYAITGVVLDPTTLQLAPDGTAILVETVAPDNATDQTVTWSTSDAGVATVVAGVVTAVADGTCDITVTTTDGSFTDVCVVTVNATDILDIHNSLVKIYPSPSTGNIYIELGEFNNSTIIEIMDIKGSMILSKEFNNVGKYNIDLTNQTKGMYIIRAYVDDKVQQGRIILQ